MAVVCKSRGKDNDRIADKLLKRAMCLRSLRITSNKVKQKLYDISITASCKRKYVVGSLYEAMPHIICGDQDFMLNHPLYPVVLWPFEPARKDHKGGYLMAQQNPNEPVYFTLKVNSNWPLDVSLNYAINEYGYIMPDVFTKDEFRKSETTFQESSRKHGPSIELTHYDSTTTDIISCLSCQSWPLHSVDFFTRERENSWPPDVILRKIPKVDCLVVGVGHPTSPSKEIEWRLSFSLAERELCYELCQPYAECMCALKAIKSSKYIDLFSESDSPTPFCSYFIKTACFWMCETSPTKGHVSTMNLIRKTLDWLIKCYEERYLPHYFIYQQNLIGNFSRECCDKMRVSLKTVKRDLWSNVMSSIAVIVGGCMDVILDHQLFIPNSPKEYSELINSKDKIKEINTNILSNDFTKEFELRCLTTLQCFVFSGIIQDYFCQKIDPLEIIQLQLDDIIELVLESDDKNSTNWLQGSLHYLYCCLGDTYTGLLKYLQDCGIYNLQDYLNKPLNCYEKGSKLLYPDGWRDQRCIGTQINVIKFYYLMNEETKLKEMLVKFEPVLSKVKRNKQILTKLRKVIIGTTKNTQVDIYAWRIVDKDIFGIAKNSKHITCFNAIVFIFYVNAKLSLKEGDIYRAYEHLNEMKSILHVIKLADTGVLNIFVQIDNIEEDIESQVSEGDDVGLGLGLSQESTTVRDACILKIENETETVESDSSSADQKDIGLDKSLFEEGKSSSENSTSSRGTWDNKTDFLLSCLGYAVGLGNVWRFPYLCYENGGGAFLIPYATMLLLAGLPMFFMELCLGQYSSSGPATVWRISPMFRGMGYGMVLISAFIGLYYNVIITYILYYMFASFTNKLPWIGCNNPWNTDMCNGIYDECLRTGNKIMTVNNTCVGVDSLSEEQLDFYNIGLNTLGEIDLSNYIDPLKSKRKLPSEEYFKNAVLHEASGIGELGTVVWPLLSCLVFAWIIIYFCLQKGIKSSGKVVYFTATFPYIVLVLFLILGLTLEGSYNGIKFFLTPRWEILYEPKVWLDAAVQIFFSLSTSWGGLLTLSSYNRFHNNCYFDAIFIALANCMTSVFAGVVIFSILGFMANELGREVSEVVDQGFGLAFIAYPEALARLPAAPVWSVLFFFMLLTLGLDTQFTIMETVMTFITDFFPNLRRNKPKVLLASCTMMCLASLICVTEAGVYWVSLLDSYSASFVMLTFATMECIIVSWVYGYDRFKEDISIMIGSARVNNKLFNYWRVCWCFITPALLSFVQVYSFVNWSAPSYNGGFPTWAHTIGWLITGSTIILVPVFIVVELRNASGTFLQRLKLISAPAADWGPLKYEHRALVRISESSVSTISDLVEQEKGKTSGSTEPNKASHDPT
ncbi:uncharacterized protein [Antedon mediterranea]|uniref:uncharacterized protein n=1 Tax=Antedon mediterranea TaxID=105859 RepID=UPI003AF42FEA